jgi:hypothetical protein
MIPPAASFLIALSRALDTLDSLQIHTWARIFEAYGGFTQGQHHFLSLVA